MNQIDALIFDMDGVLVDVSRSYRTAIIRTVDIYFTRGMHLPADGDSLLTVEDISALKNAGGFNNDWDLTAAFIRYFLNMLPELPISTLPLRRRISTLMAYLQIATHGRAPASLAELRAKKDTLALATAIAAEGGGMSALKTVTGGNNRHLLFGRGNLLKENLVQRIFQEIYLGEELFAEIYGTPAEIVREPGLIRNETALIAPATLSALAQKYSLAIATGRPRAEAEFALKHLGLADYFQAVITHDDVVAADEHGKPDPWSLREAARQLNPPPAHPAYIGDTPDDIRAAKAAGFAAIGVLVTAADSAALRMQFESLGADVVIESSEELKMIFEQNRG